MASSSSAGDESRLVHVAFNAKSTHFVAATATGIRVFACTPSLKHVFTKTGFFPSSDEVEVTSADVSPSGSLAAVVLNSERIKYWSELRGEVMGDAAAPPASSSVRALRHAGSHVLVAGHDRAALHEAARHGTRRAAEFETGPNPLGVCALAHERAQGQAFVVACPAPGAKGAVQVRRAKVPYRRVDVAAHDSTVVYVALSRDGRLLATAGSKGTLLRVFSTTHGNKLQELRRGYDRADIHCLAFSPDSKWLAASSDKGTIHVFSVNVDLSSSPPEDGDESDAPKTASAAKPTQGWSSYLRGFIPVSVPSYFQQDYSLAKFRLREGIKYMVAFSHEPHVVLIIGMDGSFYRCQFDPVNGGDMEQLEYRNFMKVE